jgi:hypothetical protein
VQPEVDGNGTVEKVFHVFAPPTVTAGFIALGFDIKKARGLTTYVASVEANRTNACRGATKALLG